MAKNLYEIMKNTAYSMYSQSEPWDTQNDYAQYVIHNTGFEYTQRAVDKYVSPNATVLNAGSGKTVYKTKAKVIYMDIISKYIKKFENHIVGSIEKIPLKNNSVDCVICVGCVLSYANAQKAISEFSRVLKKGGILILEYDRCNSIYFPKKVGKKSVQWVETSYYNFDGKDITVCYNENFIKQLADFYSLKRISEKHYYFFPMLLVRLGMAAQTAARFVFADKFFGKFGQKRAYMAFEIYKKSKNRNLMEVKL